LGFLNGLALGRLQEFICSDWGAMEAVRTKWDTAGLALLGASLGTVMQGSHEFLEHVATRSAGQELIAHIVAEITVGALACAALFTAIAVVRNRVVSRDGDGKRHPSEISWHPNDFVFIGAVLTIGLILAHETFDFLSGRWEFECGFSADPFSHIVQESVIAGLGGELMFRTIARIRKWGSIPDKGAHAMKE
jgi:hypothetical protein